MGFNGSEKINRSNRGFSNEVPPLLEHVKIIFDQQELEEKEAIRFFNHFQEHNWHTKTGVPIKNWKHILDQWIWELKVALRKR